MAAGAAPEAALFGQPLERRADLLARAHTCRARLLVLDLEVDLLAEHWDAPGA